jgi:hypothetical protein
MPNALSATEPTFIPFKGIDDPWEPTDDPWEPVEDPLDPSAPALM